MSGRGFCPIQPAQYSCSGPVPVAVTARRLVLFQLQRLLPALGQPHVTAKQLPQAGPSDPVPAYLFFAQDKNLTTKDQRTDHLTFVCCHQRVFDKISQPRDKDPINKPASAGCCSVRILLGNACEKSAPLLRAAIICSASASVSSSERFGLGSRIISLKLICGSLFNCFSLFSSCSADLLIFLNCRLNFWRRLFPHKISALILFRTVRCGTFSCFKTAEPGVPSRRNSDPVSDGLLHRVAAQCRGPQFCRTGFSTCHR